MKPKIIKCTIGPYPRSMAAGMYDPMPKVNVQFDTGEEKTLFEFYPDEISFAETELIGMTEESAWRLKFNKDLVFLKKYLKS